MHTHMDLDLHTLFQTYSGFCFVRARDSCIGGDRTNWLKTKRTHTRSLRPQCSIPSSYVFESLCPGVCEDGFERQRAVPGVFRGLRGGGRARPSSPALHTLPLQEVQGLHGAYITGGGGGGGAVSDARFRDLEST